MAYKVGQKVRWTGDGQPTYGEITSIRTSPFEIKGKNSSKTYTRHASKDNPVYVLKSHTGYISYHYANALRKYPDGGFIQDENTIGGYYPQQFQDGGNMNKKRSLNKMAKGGKAKVTYYDFEGNPIEDINAWGNPNNIPQESTTFSIQNNIPIDYTNGQHWAINPNGSISIDYRSLANDRTSYGPSVYDSYTNRPTAFDGNYGSNVAINYPGDNIYRNNFYKGGGPMIKPSHKGKFTEWSKQHGFKSVQEAASHVLANKDKYDLSIVRQANFAHIFGGRNYADGGDYNSVFPKTFEEAQQQGLYNNDPNGRKRLFNYGSSQDYMGYANNPNNYIFSQPSINGSGSSYIPQTPDNANLQQDLASRPSGVESQGYLMDLPNAGVGESDYNWVGNGSNPDGKVGGSAAGVNAMGKAAGQVLSFADNLRRGFIGLNQDLAKGSLALTSALSSNLNQPEQKRKSIRQAFDDNTYDRGFGRLYYANGGEVNNYNTFVPNASNIISNPLTANAEIEEGEVVKLPNGTTIPVEGNNAFKHYENNNMGTTGTPVNIPEGSFIYSDRKIKGEPTKLNKEMASEILNKKVNKSMSMGDIAKKLDTSKYDKVLNDVSATPIQKRTAAINKELNTVKLNQLADYQESFKLKDNQSNKFPNGGYLTNDDIPQGFAPDIAQGYYDENGNYINAQPTQRNFNNPRYMFLKPTDPLPTGNLTTGTPVNFDPIVQNASISPIPTANIQLRTIDEPKQFNSRINVEGNPVIDPYTPASTEDRKRSLRGLGDKIDWSNIGDMAKNTAENIVGGVGNALDSAISALPGLVGVLSDVPIIGTPTDLQYLPNARMNNSVTRRVNDQIATKFNERAKFDNPALQQAYDAQLVANSVPILQEAAATDYQNYLRRQDAINQANLQISNQEAQINNSDQARVNELIMRKKDSAIRDIQQNLQNAYIQRMGAKADRNKLALVNQMSPNYQYNANQQGQGVQFVYDEDGNPWFKDPNTGKLFRYPVANQQKNDDNTKKKS